MIKIENEKRKRKEGANYYQKKIVGGKKKKMLRETKNIFKESGSAENFFFLNVTR